MRRPTVYFRVIEISQQTYSLVALLKCILTIMAQMTPKQTPAIISYGFAPFYLLYHIVLISTMSKYPYYLYRAPIKISLLTVQNDKGHLLNSAGVDPQNHYITCVFAYILWY